LFFVVLIKGAVISPQLCYLYFLLATLYHFADLYFWTMLDFMILKLVAWSLTPWRLLVGQIYSALYSHLSACHSTIGGLDLFAYFHLSCDFL